MKYIHLSKILNPYLLQLGNTLLAVCPVPLFDSAQAIHPSTEMIKIEVVEASVHMYVLTLPFDRG